MSDPVNHPRHYTSHPSGVEAITVTEHMNFCLGNAVKYIWRAGEKGDAITDLRKSRWYLDREIARLERAQLVGNHQVPLDSSPGENSLADADRALAAEAAFIAAANPAVVIGLLVEIDRLRAALERIGHDPECNYHARYLSGLALAEPAT